MNRIAPFVIGSVIVIAAGAAFWHSQSVANGGSTTDDGKPLPPPLPGGIQLQQALIVPDDDAVKGGWRTSRASSAELWRLGQCVSEELGGQPGSAQSALTTCLEGKGGVLRDAKRVSNEIWGGLENAKAIETAATLGAVACKSGKDDCEAVPNGDLKKVFVDSGNKITAALDSAQSLLRSHGSVFGVTPFRQTFEGLRSLVQNSKPLGSGLRDFTVGYRGVTNALMKSALSNHEWLTHKLGSADRAAWLTRSTVSPPVSDTEKLRTAVEFDLERWAEERWHDVREWRSRCLNTSDCDAVTSIAIQIDVEGLQQTADKDAFMALVEKWPLLATAICQEREVRLKVLSERRAGCDTAAARVKVAARWSAAQRARDLLEELQAGAVLKWPALPLGDQTYEFVLIRDITKSLLTATLRLRPSGDTRTAGIDTGFDLVWKSGMSPNVLAAPAESAATELTKERPSVAARETEVSRFVRQLASKFPGSPADINIQVKATPEGNATFVHGGGCITIQVLESTSPPGGCAHSLTLMKADVLAQSLGELVGGALTLVQGEIEKRFKDSLEKTLQSIGIFGDVHIDCCAADKPPMLTARVASGGKEIRCDVDRTAVEKSVLACGSAALESSAPFLRILRTAASTNGWTATIQDGARRLGQIQFLSKSGHLVGPLEFGNSIRVLSADIVLGPGEMAVSNAVVNLPAIFGSEPRTLALRCKTSEDFVCTVGDADLENLTRNINTFIGTLGLKETDVKVQSLSIGRQGVRVLFDPPSLDADIKAALNEIFSDVYGDWPTQLSRHYDQVQIVQKAAVAKLASVTSKLTQALEAKLRPLVDLGDRQHFSAFDTDLACLGEGSSWNCVLTVSYPGCEKPLLKMQPSGDGMSRSLDTDCVNRWIRQFVGADRAIDQLRQVAEPTATGISAHLSLQNPPAKVDFTCQFATGRCDVGAPRVEICTLAKKVAEVKECRSSGDSQATLDIKIPNTELVISDVDYSDGRLSFARAKLQGASLDAIGAEISKAIKAAAGLSFKGPTLNVKPQANGIEVCATGSAQLKSPLDFPIQLDALCAVVYANSIEMRPFDLASIVVKELGKLVSGEYKLSDGLVVKINNFKPEKGKVTFDLEGRFESVKSVDALRLEGTACIDLGAGCPEVLHWKTPSFFDLAMNQLAKFALDSLPTDNTFKISNHRLEWNADHTVPTALVFDGKLAINDKLVLTASDIAVSGAGISLRGPFGTEVGTNIEAGYVCIDTIGVKLVDGGKKVEALATIVPFECTLKYAVNARAVVGFDLVHPLQWKGETTLTVLTFIKVDKSDMRADLAIPSAEFHSAFQDPLKAILNHEIQWDLDASHRMHGSLNLSLFNAISVDFGIAFDFGRNSVVFTSSGLKLGDFSIGNLSAEFNGSTTTIAVGVNSLQLTMTFDGTGVFQNDDLLKEILKRLLKVPNVLEGLNQVLQGNFNINPLSDFGPAGKNATGCTGNCSDDTVPNSGPGKGPGNGPGPGGTGKDPAAGPQTNNNNANLNGVMTNPGGAATSTAGGSISQPSLVPGRWLIRGEAVGKEVNVFTQESGSTQKTFLLHTPTPLEPPLFDTASGLPRGLILSANPGHLVLAQSDGVRVVWAGAPIFIPWSTLGKAADAYERLTDTKTRSEVQRAWSMFAGSLGSESLFQRVTTLTPCKVLVVKHPAATQFFELDHERSIRVAANGGVDPAELPLCDAIHSVTGIADSQLYGSLTAGATAVWTVGTGDKRTARLRIGGEWKPAAVEVADRVPDSDVRNLLPPLSAQTSGPPPRVVLGSFGVLVTTASEWAWFWRGDGTTPVAGHNSVGKIKAFIHADTSLQALLKGQCDDPATPSDACLNAVVKKAVSSAEIIYRAPFGKN